MVSRYGMVWYGMVWHGRCMHGGTFMVNSTKDGPPWFYSHVPWLHFSAGDHFSFCVCECESRSTTTPPHEFSRFLLVIIVIDRKSEPRIWLVIVNSSSQKLVPGIRRQKKMPSPANSNCALYVPTSTLLTLFFSRAIPNRKVHIGISNKSVT